MTDVLDRFPEFPHEQRDPVPPRRLPLDEVHEKLERIYDTTAEILRLARERNILPGAAAESVAHDRIRQARPGRV